MKYKTIGTVRLAKRLKNLSKGDVILDTAFNKYANGVTSYSLCIWEVIKKHVDISLIHKAEMTFTQKDWYTLTLSHKDGYTFKLRGMSSGYYGEGSRATEKVLLDCGFSQSAIDIIFIKNNENWIIRKFATKGTRVHIR
jgi:hypothetical protein